MDDAAHITVPLRPTSSLNTNFEPGSKVRSTLGWKQPNVLHRTPLATVTLSPRVRSECGARLTMGRPRKTHWPPKRTPLSKHSSRHRNENHCRKCPENRPRPREIALRSFGEVASQLSVCSSAGLDRGCSTMLVTMLLAIDQSKRKPELSG
jgi:hypothetical protein